MLVISAYNTPKVGSWVLIVKGVDPLNKLIVADCVQVFGSRVVTLRLSTPDLIEGLGIETQLHVAVLN